MLREGNACYKLYVSIIHVFYRYAFTPIVDFGDDDEDDDNMTLSDAFGEFYHYLKLSTLIVVSFKKFTTIPKFLCAITWSV